ncbi:MAG: hypothetical protein UHP28_03480 [Treponema sp.]|nr:hypothetical protein [Treponema sp.]
MEFYLNNEKIDVTLEGEKTVGDVLKSFEITCEQNNAAVIGIQVNGKQITADLFDEEAKKELKDDTKFNFNVVTQQSIKESFKELSFLFKELALKLSEVPVALQSGRDKEAHTSIKNLADSIEEFCHIAALASLFQEYTSITIDGNPFNEFFADFSPVLNDFEQALKTNDTVSIGDLAEYEICPRLNAISKSLENLA